MEFSNERVVTSTSMKMLVEITIYDRHIMKGTIYSLHIPAPYEFTDLSHMIGKMEEVFDENRFPEAFQSTREFTPTPGGAKTFRTGRADIMKEALKKIEKKKPGGSKCTFEISVKFRQSATWQGQILWAEKKVKQNFRSVLEMLKLMDEAISESIDNLEEEPMATWAEA